MLRLPQCMYTHIHTHTRWASLIRTRSAQHSTRYTPHTTLHTTTPHHHKYKCVVGSDAHVSGVARRLGVLFDTYGVSDYIGEDISIREHSFQAMHSAQCDAMSESVQTAALLHDVGHMLGLEAGFEPAMDGCGTEDHESVGSTFTRDLGLGTDESYLIQNHVEAKRYLCWRDPEYHQGLSEASKVTLSFQGGVMTSQEAKEKQEEPLWTTVLSLRTYDESAKDAARVGGETVESVMPLVEGCIQANACALREAKAHAHPYLDQEEEEEEYTEPRCLAYVLSSEQKRRFAEDGYLVVKEALSPETVASLSRMADDLVASAEAQEGHTASVDADASTALAPAQKLLFHREQISDTERAVCRIENFCKWVPAWSEVCFGAVEDMVSQAFGERAVLFKDKLNFKGPGGAGFLSHQDATAYATDEFASRHISVMVAIDASTVKNGCLQVARGRHAEGIFPHAHGVIAEDVDRTFTYDNVLVEPGDIVLFDSYLPHRSEANATEGWRRLAYLTFNPASEGDHHAPYYAKKEESMKQGAISLNLDFAGKVV